MKNPFLFILGEIITAIDYWAGHLNVIVFVETVMSANQKVSGGDFGAILADVDIFSPLKMSKLFTSKFNDQFSD